MTKRDHRIWSAGIGPAYVKYVRRSNEPTPLQLLGTILPLVTGVAGWHFWQPLSAQLSARFSNGQPPSTYCALPSDAKTVLLPDGSSLVLNASTCVSVAISKSERRVQFESGEVTFQVAHDPSRPFVVETGRVAIWDLATQFNVRSVEGDTQITVLEGAVRISPRGITARPNDVSLAAGQQIEIPSDTTAVSLIRRITPQDIGRMTARQSGVIEIDGQPLRAVFTELERHQPISLRSTDVQILNLRISGNFSTTDINSFLDYLGKLCIRGERHIAEQSITLTRVVGEPGAGCP